MLAKKGILPGIIISALLISYLFLTVIVRFNVFVSDVSGYWNDSLNLITPFHKNHVPLYPIIISIVRFLTFNIFQPTLLIWTFDKHNEPCLKR